MAFMNSFDISGYGLSAQRFRLNLISTNIANASTTRTDEGGPYRRQSVVFRAVDFDKHLNRQLAKNTKPLGYEDPLDEELGYEKKLNPAVMSVIVDKVVRDDTTPKMRYEPTHPDADKDGYVAYPNVNPVVEMADMIEASRAYQANVAAFQSAKTIANTALEMMRS
ncbi:MAG: flagellar basal body rod protein FlgC [Helicobacteraceae bacterium]|jgi:flagellar basal-body rod protein FlgC|nr:flagellar basal body rod protein FlgC [Helicobacteraceae bacterium]